MSFLYTRYFWISFFLVLLSFFGGLFLGRFSPLSKPPVQTNLQAPAAKNLSFDSQQASIRGKLLKINASTITVLNSKNVSSEVKLASNVYVTKYDSKGKAVSSSSLNQEDIGKSVVVNLALIPPATEYQVIAVTFIPSLPPLKQNQPAASQLKPEKPVNQKQ